MNSTDSRTVKDVDVAVQSGCGDVEGARRHLADVTGSTDPDVLRAALIRESCERRRAECRADMQTSVAKLALDLLVREPDVDGFFGALARTMVEEGDSHACALWLLDEAGQRCEPWMAYVDDHLLNLRTLAGGACRREASVSVRRDGGPSLRVHPRLDADRRVSRRGSAFT